MPGSNRLLRSLLAAAAVLAAGPAGATAAAPRSYDCPQHASEFLRVSAGVLFTKGKVLYGCTAYYGDPPRTYRLGPWSPKSKAAFDGSTVVWTTRITAPSGHREDRVWASDAARAGGTWLRGLRPTVGPGSATDVKVSRMAAEGDAVAWVTTRGTVMLGSPSADDAPEAVGADPGLAAPLAAKGHRLVVGHWPALASPAFSGTLRLKVVEGGDGDECGGVTPYEVTVRPVATAPRVGARWLADWTSTSSACA